MKTVQSAEGVVLTQTLLTDDEAKVQHCLRAHFEQVGKVGYGNHITCLDAALIFKDESISRSGMPREIGDLSSLGPMFRLFTSIVPTPMLSCSRNPRIGQLQIFGEWIGCKCSK